MTEVSDLKLLDIETGDLCPFFLAACILPPDQFDVQRTVSGKGLSREEARCNCRYEACERSAAIVPLPGQYQSVWQPYHIVGDGAVDPRDLILLSGEQYADRGKWNSTKPQEFHFPDRFDPDMPIEWVTATDLTDNKEVLVPAAWVYLGYPNPWAHGFPTADSGGLASNTSLEGAIENACLELIERDAVAIWWYNALPKPLLRINPQKSRLVKDFARWAKSQGREFWLLDLTTDLTIPVAAAVTCDKNTANFSIGFGAGWTNEAAAYAAMGELVQFEASKKLMKKFLKTHLHHLISILLKPDPRIVAYLLPTAARKYSFHKKPAGGITFLLTMMLKKGLKPVIFRYNNSEVPTVRAMIPGLRSLWPRFAPGRLFDVPWKNGELSGRKKEHELNSVPILY